MTTAVRRKALTVAEVYALPAMATAKDAFAAIGISQELGYELIRTKQFPINTIPLGRAIRVRRSDLLAFLGLENSDATGGPAPAASDELINKSTAK
ncbi:hypothetical protein [Streptomyces sp. NPDC057909]|uniref:hypothetical protein n=1 Tax=Streptomyces sp. NPDC057909 TaxID=3346277 RepID=UPI0036E620CC